jgi:hypothetical protein
VLPGRNNRDTKFSRSLDEMIALTQNCLGDSEQPGRRGFERNEASPEALLLELKAPLLECASMPDVIAQAIELG